MSEKSKWSDEIAAEVEDTSDWTDDEGEIRELTAADFARMKPFSELPAEMQEMLLSIKTATFHAETEEVPVPVPVSRSVLEGFCARGEDWQGRVDQVLREWLEQHKAS